MQVRPPWFAILYVVLGVHLSNLNAQTWNVNANGTWGTAGNWTPATVPNSIGATVTLGNIISANRAIDVGATRTLGTLTINDNNDYTLNNGTLSFDVASGSAALNVQSTGSPVINSAISLNDALVINHTGTGVLDINGNIDNNGSLLTVQGTGSTIMDGAISDTGGLTKSGTGSLTLGGATANSFSGTTTVNGGTLDLNKTAGINNAIVGNLTIGDGSGTDTVRLLAANQISDSITVNLNSSGVFNLNNNNETVTDLNMTGGSVTTGTGTLTLTGSTPVTSNATSSSATITGIVSLYGGGTKTISVANGSAATDLVISANIGESWYTGIDKTGSGTLLLSGNNSFTADFTISGGVVVAASNNALGAAATYGNTIASGAALHLSGGVTLSESNVYVSGTGPGGNGALRSISGSNIWNGVVTMNAATTFAADSGATLTLNNSIAQNYAATYTGDGNIVAAGSIYGSGSLNKTGLGTMTLSGGAANSYGGGTVVSGGTLVLAKTSGINATGTTGVVINSGATLLLGNSNQIADYTGMTLSGGTFSTGATTGFGETLGTLTLTSSSSIDLGTGVHMLAFGNSSGASWSGTLTIYDWVGTAGASGTAGQIFFGSSLTGLTGGQLAQVSFNGYGSGAQLLSTGELVPVTVIPEPGVVLAALFVLLFIAWREREGLIGRITRKRAALLG